MKHKVSDKDSDVNLLAAIANKDSFALSVFYDRYAPRIYGLAVKILRDENQAQDVLQDLFLFLWQNADRFASERGSAGAWILTMCRNRCIDKLRQREKRLTRTTKLDETLVAVSPANESEQPLQFVHEKELQRIVTDALATLPEEQRKPIEMAYFGGRTQSEIAKELDLPLGTVKTRVRLGMQKLRDLTQISRTDN